jgi:hypothetical protein
MLPARRRQLRAWSHETGKKTPGGTTRDTRDTRTHKGTHETGSCRTRERNNTTCVSIQLTLSQHDRRSYTHLTRMRVNT